MKKLFLIITVFLAACSPNSQPVTTIAGPENPTATILPSAVPSATPTPKPTATPTLAYPVQANTPFPEPQEVISADNISSLEALAIWKGPNIKELQYSQDGKYLIVNFYQGSAIYYDMSTYELTTETSNVQLVQALTRTLDQVPEGDHKAISADGKYGANTIGSTINVYELPNTTPIRRDTGFSEYTDVTFSPTSQILAITDGGAYYWSFLEPDSDPLSLWGNASTAYAFAPNGTRLLIGTEYGGLYFHDLTNPGPNGEPGFFSQAHAGYIKDVAASPDSKYFATVSFDNRIKIWNPVDGALLHTLDDLLPGRQGGKIISAENSSQLLVGYEDSTVKLWDISSGTIVDQFQDPKFYQTFHGPTAVEVYGGISPMYDYSISADGSLIGIAGHSAAGVWNTKTHEQVFEYEIQSTSKHVELSPDGKFVAVANSVDANIILFDIATGAQVWKAESGFFYDMLFSPDGSLLAAINLNSLKPAVFIHDATHGKRIKTFVGVQDIAFSPDGEYIVLVSEQLVSMVKVQDGSSLFERKYEASPGGVCFSPDGKILVFHEDRQPEAGPPQVDLIFFDVEKQEEIDRILGNGYHDNMTCSFSGDGKYLAYGDLNGITLLGIKKD